MTGIHPCSILRLLAGLLRCLSCMDWVLGSCVQCTDVWVASICQKLSWTVFLLHSQIMHHPLTIAKLVPELSCTAQSSCYKTLQANW